MVQWLQPAIPDLPLRSEEEKQLGMEQGREAPPAELLQPTLDPALPSFVPRPELKLSGTVKGGASDVLPGLVNLWIERFREHYPDVNIEIGRPYAGSLGMLEVIDGSYDFVFVSRELKPTDISSFNETYGYDPLTVPVAGGSYRHYGFLDAIGFFVNIGNPLDKITFNEIDAIFSSTRHRGGAEITTWGQLGLGGEWADRPIHAYGVEPWNGFEEFVRQRVLSTGDSRGEWREDVRFSHQAFPLSEQVANDPLAIGYTGLAYITRGVKMLPLAVDNRYIAPSYENVADASYPLSRLIFFNSNKNPETGLNPILDEFLRFILSQQGQQAVLDHAIFLPLRKGQYDQSIGKLD
jgi:phosphate transport system substrate-binding protein